MKLTRPQLVGVVVIGVLALGVWVCLIGLVVQNSRQVSQLLAPTATPLASLDQTSETDPLATETLVPEPSPTPTPLAPQTRYDLKVASDPEDAELRIERGYAYIELGAYDHAIGDFDVAIRLDDTLATAYSGRGEAYFHLKEWTKSVEDLEMGLSMDPGLAQACALHGHLLSEWGQYGPALTALRRAVELDNEDPRTRIWLAQTLLHSGNPEQAETEYTMAISLEAHPVEAYAGRAMVLAELGEFGLIERLSG